MTRAAEAPAPPIFIGGLMKSGSSLLRKLLCNHPALFGGLETHWCSSEFRDSFRDLDSRRQRWLREFYEVSPEDQRRLLADAADPYRYLDAFLGFCAQRAGKRRWAEKTPDNVLYRALITEHWPDAPLLHAVRDYRDVFASWKRNKKGTLEDFVRHCRRINEALGALLGRRTPSYLEVRYEDLVTDTATTLRDVLAFLGEPWVEGLDDYAGDPSEHELVLRVSGKHSPTAVSLGKPIFTSSVGQYRSVLSTEEVSALERQLGTAMRIWGWL